MTVGADLNALRKRRGLTLDELSALCGISRDDLGLYERGAMTPRPDTVQKIAQALDVPITAIREGMGWTAPEPAEAWETAGDDRLLRRGILENLREARQGKTTILIAHRVTTIEKMDKILFVEDGELVAMGPHGELYESCPEYRKMVDLQKLEEEGDDRNE